MRKVSLIGRKKREVDVPRDVSSTIRLWSSAFRVIKNGTRNIARSILSGLPFRLAFPELATPNKTQRMQGILDFIR